MVIEHAPFTRNTDELLGDLTKAAKQLEEINKKVHGISSIETHNVANMLEGLNKSLTPILWEVKSAPFQGLDEGMHHKIQKALDALVVFQSYHPERNPSTQRSIEQAITALAFTLKSVLSSFDKNLGDLKKYKIGQRVERVYKGKPT